MKSSRIEAAKGPPKRVMLAGIGLVAYICTPAQARKLRGVLGFTLTGLYGKVRRQWGTACTAHEAVLGYRDSCLKW